MSVIKSTREASVLISLHVHLQISLMSRSVWRDVSNVRDQVARLSVIHVLVIGMRISSSCAPQREEIKRNLFVMSQVYLVALTVPGARERVVHRRGRLMGLPRRRHGRSGMPNVQDAKSGTNQDMDTSLLNQLEWVWFVEGALAIGREGVDGYEGLEPDSAYSASAPTIKKPQTRDRTTQAQDARQGSFTR